jgi:glycosyltransferase involved in cell wall biosynthesis
MRSLDASLFRFYLGTETGRRDQGLSADCLGGWTMRIAQVVPLMESVPPRLYGGTERHVSYLTEELVKQGHQVTLFASGDSATSARLIAAVPQALRLSGNLVDYSCCNVLQLEQVRQHVNDFDVINFHTDFFHFCLVRAGALRDAVAVTTLHGRIDLQNHRMLLTEFGDMPLVSISGEQRAPLPEANWVGTVYPGLPSQVCNFTSGPTGEYFAFLGRISPEKGPERAIEIARRAGAKLRIAAKVDSVDQSYFRERIQPFLRDRSIEFLGEIDEKQKPEFLGNARALLLPIDWSEPFGMVFIEAMSCGTPVIAWRRGSVPEIVDQGVTGYIVESIDQAVDATKLVPRIDRAAVRKRFEERFTVERMAKQYVSLYAQLIVASKVSAAA